MKIPNCSYRKVTCCKTNSWKSGGRHSCVFQVFPDISISLTHKQTPRQILILHDASKILGMTSWMSHHICKNIRWSQSLWQHPGSHVPKALEVLLGGGWRLGCRGKEDCSKNHEFTSQALQSLHSSHEEIFSCILFFLPPIFMGCTFCARSYAKF